MLHTRLLTGFQLYSTCTGISVDSSQTPLFRTLRHSFEGIISPAKQHRRMKPCLEALPIELIEHIVTFLEPRDIASLRLTSRTIENNASHGSFTSLFKHKSVELRKRALQKMVRVTSQGRLGCLLQHCTVTGVLRNKTTAAYNNADYSRLLAAAFGNLKRRSQKISLASLRLCVAARSEVTDGERTDRGDSRSWRTVWDTALHTFEVTMDALNSSQLPVTEHLDIFGSLRGCSLGCDAFLAFAPKFVSKHVFGSLKKLTVSLSASHEAIEEQENGAIDDESLAHSQSRRSELVLQDIIQVSCIMPELEILDLHWFDLGENVATSEVPSEFRNDSSAISASMPLKECSLRGIHVSESDLLQFLEAVRPTVLTLTDLRLVSGTYATIFRFLTDPESPVTYYHLDDIREGRNLVHFHIPGNSKFQYRGGTVGPSTLTRQNDQVKEAIRYRFASGRPLGSGQRTRFVISKAREFGPPNRQYLYDFMKLNSERLVVASNDSDDGEEPDETVFFV